VRCIGLSAAQFSGYRRENMKLPTVAKYLAALPRSPRRAQRLRKVINEKLPDGYEKACSRDDRLARSHCPCYPAGYGENPKVPRFPTGVAGFPRLIRKSSQLPP